MIYSGPYLLSLFLLYFSFFFLMQFKYIVFLYIITNSVAVFSSWKFLQFLVSNYCMLLQFMDAFIKLDIPLVMNEFLKILLIKLDLSFICIFLSFYVEVLTSFSFSFLLPADRREWKNRNNIRKRWSFIKLVLGLESRLRSYVMKHWCIHLLLKTYHLRLHWKIVLAPELNSLQPGLFQQLHLSLFCYSLYMI